MMQDKSLTHTVRPMDTQPVEQEALSAGLDTLEVYIEDRKNEILRLTAQAKSALEIADDLTRLNAALEQAGRPDLTMTAKAPQMPLKTIEDLNSVNNFIPDMTGFGIHEFLPKENEDDTWQDYEIRVPTEQELAVMIKLGGRRDGFHEMALELGLKESAVNWLYDNSHLREPAFMRMWIIAPDLAESLMKKLLEVRNGSHREEFFIAYTVMSQLVDQEDPYVRRDGGFDDWHLCR